MDERFRVFMTGLLLLIALLAIWGGVVLYMNVRIARVRREVERRELLAEVRELRSAVWDEEVEDEDEEDGQNG